MDEPQELQEEVQPTNAGIGAHIPVHAGLGDGEMDAAFTKAVVSGRWFAAVVYVQDEKDHALVKTSNFPRSAFATVMRKVREFALREEEATDGQGGEARVAFGTLMAFVDAAEQTGAIDKAEAAALNRAMSGMEQFVDKIAANGIRKEEAALPTPPPDDIYHPPAEPGDN